MLSTQLKGFQLLKKFLLKLSESINYSDNTRYALVYQPNTIVSYSHSDYLDDRFSLRYVLCDLDISHKQRNFLTILSQIDNGVLDGILAANLIERTANIFLRRTNR